MQMRSPREQ